MQITGIDASFAQPGFDWKQAASQGIQFGICKLSEGTGLLDEQFAYHWNGIKEAGLARGFYHFSRWDLGTDPQAEAQFVLDHLPSLGTGDFIALDIETSPIGVPARPLPPWAPAWPAGTQHPPGLRPLV